MKELRHWENVPKVTYTVETRTVPKKVNCTTTKTLHENYGLKVKVPVSKSNLKRQRKENKKLRREWNKNSRTMIGIAKGNLNSTSIARMEEKIDKTNKDTGKEMEWSAGEKGIDERIGKFQYLMHPRKEALDHPSATRLVEYATVGCPADCGPAWDLQHIVSALQHEPHKSALKSKALEALQTEVDEKVKQGYAKINQWKDIKNNLPTNVKVSPVAMIPHKTRSYRTILDLSFNLMIDGKKLPSVNECTIPTAPQHSMKELGRVLERLVSLMAVAPSNSPDFRFSKLDIKDGFWRVKVTEQDSWIFCYVLPPKIINGNVSLDDIRIVVPDSLQMEWTESPSFSALRQKRQET